MKNLILNFMLLLTVVISFTSCNKKDPIEIIEKPVVVTNPPPVGGDYWLIQKPNAHIYWTQDFITYNELSTALVGTPYIFGDTLICVSNTSSGATISYGSILNLSNFKTITSSKTNPYPGYIKGNFVAQSQDGNNYYLGYCNTKKGETSLNYILQQNGVHFEQFYNIRDLLVTRVNTSLGSNIAYSYFSNDSLKWMAFAEPVPACKLYDGANNLVVGLGQGGNIATTSDADLNTANWSLSDLTYANTTDSTGTFNNSQFAVNSDFFNVNNHWKIYGYINVSSNDHNLPAVNISTDNGTTWVTTLLTGVPTDIPPHTGIFYRCLISKSATFIASNNDVFKSNDGINFTKIMTGADAQTFWEISNSTIYVK